MVETHKSKIHNLLTILLDHPLQAFAESAEYDIVSNNHDVKLDGKEGAGGKLMSGVENDNHVLIREITPRNILSFGPKTAPLALGPLNVFIGPNGSGKSNFIDVLSLLRATPGDMREILRRGGGGREWVWKGDLSAEPSLDLLVESNMPFVSLEDRPLRHSFSLYLDEQGWLLVLNEEISYGVSNSELSMPNGNLYHYNRNEKYAILNVKGEHREIASDSLNVWQSILAQRRDPESYLEISYLAHIYEKIRIYREWSFGRNTIYREAQKADMRNDRLEEDFSNLGMYLSRLRKDPRTKKAIIDAICDLYSGFTDFEVIAEGGSVQIFFMEGTFSIPASRLSDGSLRYLTLVSLLCDPTPAPLICIEEPELGLHPDILPKLAELLVNASERTQLVITTHSDILVDALSARPETVIVCEKHDGQTTMQRLDPEKLSVWLEKYSLGELWTRGELGGTRW